MLVDNLYNYPRGYYYHFVVVVALTIYYFLNNKNFFKYRCNRIGHHNREEVHSNRIVEYKKRDSKRKDSMQNYYSNRVVVGDVVDYYCPAYC